MLIALCQRRPRASLADKRYDADAIRADLANRRVKTAIPGPFSRTQPIRHDRELYKQRNRTEHMVDYLRQRGADCCALSMPFEDLVQAGPLPAA